MVAAAGRRPYAENCGKYMENIRLVANKTLLFLKKRGKRTKMNFLEWKMKRGL